MVAYSLSAGQGGPDDQDSDLLFSSSVPERFQEHAEELAAALEARQIGLLHGQVWVGTIGGPALHVLTTQAKGRRRGSPVLLCVPLALPK